MDKYDLKWGDHTYIIKDPRYAGTFWKLEKRMRVNVKLRNKEDASRLVTVSPSLVEPYDPNNPVPLLISSALDFNPGQPVRWSRRRHEIFVVCRQSKESVTIAKFGGESGGQVYRTHPGTLTKVKANIGGSK